MTAPNGWAPANEVETALAQAVAGGERREFFRLILAAELYLPAFLEAEPDAPQRFVTMDLFGRQFLPVFTAPSGLARAVGGTAEAYTVTTYTELRDKWPSPDWGLAINPGSPIDAFVTVEAVEAAARGDLTVPTADELIAEGRAEALAAALATADGEAYLQALLDCDVFVPAHRPVPAGELMTTDYPWRVTLVPVDDPRPDEPATRPTIEVVVVPAGSAPAGSAPTGPGTVVPFLVLLVAWPDPEYQLAVVAAGRTVTLPGEYLAALAMTSAIDPEDADDPDQ
jgi:hypothetical protein